MIKRKEFVGHGLLCHLTDKNQAIILAILIIFILIINKNKYDEIPIWLFAIMIIIPIIFLYGIHLIVNLYKISRTFDQTPHLGKKKEMVFSNDGICSKTDRSSSKISWKDVLKIHRRFSFIEIYTGPKAAIYIPVNAFEVDQYIEFKELVKQNSFIKNNL